MAVPPCFTRIAAVLALTVFSALGCSANGSPTSSGAEAAVDRLAGSPTSADQRQDRPASASTQAVVTPAQARTLLTRNRQLWARAIRNQGAGLEKILADTALRQSRAKIRFDRLLGRTATLPTPISQVQVYVPRPLGNLDWFAASFRESGGYGTAVLARTGGSWKLVSGSWSRVKPPAVALDKGGSAVGVADGDGQRLLLSPRQLAVTFAKNQATFGQAGTQVLADGIYTNEAGAARRAERQAVEGQWLVQRQDRAGKSLYALRTVDGGALVWHSITDTQTFTALRRDVQELRFTQDSARALSQGRAFTTTATITAHGTFLTHIPANTGKARTIGDYYTLADVRGR
ncbi:hypothetical protein Acor_84380 [Acrocarpospora corrugata]|uniref:DUF8094 domain-containing protein n=1 Tax=Acrocarpospora corrugata TaxID=35763 RepID=A0A5M3WDF8_9ACTN|nr:hypothetical protein [Acrocarpospora corrugata]GES06369.1 hypothetical protein Acor_84380 [Acrocarpospora corrugata]